MRCQYGQGTFSINRGSARVGCRNRGPGAIRGGRAGRWRLLGLFIGAKRFSIFIILHSDAFDRTVAIDRAALELVAAGGLATRSARDPDEPG